MFSPSKIYLNWIKLSKQTHKQTILPVTKPIISNKQTIEEYTMTSAKLTDKLISCPKMKIVIELCKQNRFRIFQLSLPKIDYSMYVRCP